MKVYEIGTQAVYFVMAHDKEDALATLLETGLSFTDEEWKDLKENVVKSEPETELTVTVRDLENGVGIPASFRGVIAFSY